MIGEAKDHLNRAAEHYRECNSDLRKAQRDFNGAGKLFAAMAELAVQMGTARANLVDTHQKNKARSDTIGAHLQESMELAKYHGGILGSRLEYEIEEAAHGNERIREMSKMSEELLAVPEDEFTALAAEIAEAKRVLNHGVQYCWGIQEQFNAAADSCQQQAQNL